MLKTTIGIAGLREIGDASLFHPARVDTPEHLDLGEGSLADVRANLNEMWQINYRLGGLSALTRHLFPRLQALKHPAVILDLGTGGAEIPIYIARWAQRHNLTVQIIAVDWATRNLQIAAENITHHPNITLLAADALHLPVDRVDYVISSLFLHHFTSDALIALLRHAYNRAKYGIIMNDLVRGYLPMLAFKAVQPIFARHWLTRTDGALSIRRAYTPPELLTLAQQAGIPNPRVYRHFPWRMTLIGEAR